MQLLQNVPLISQHWKLDNWKKLGFQSFDDAEYWQRSCCGVLCLQEIASYLNKTSYKTSDLIKKGILLNAYSEERGWKHEGLVRLAEELGLHARTAPLTSDLLKEAISKKQLPIVSIKWAFIPKRSLKELIFFWKKYGGHLAVAVGYNSNGFYINHTSKIAEENWKSRLIPYEKFKKSYTGRAILIWKKKPGKDSCPTIHCSDLLAS